MAGDERGNAVDANEIAAVSDWVASLEDDVAAEYGAQVKRFGAAAALAVPKTDTFFFNRVIGLGTLQQASPGLVRDIASFYHDIGSRFMVHVTQNSRHDQLADWLAQEGLVRQDQWITLYHDSQSIPSLSSDVRLERVRPDCAGTFAATFCAGYGMPDEWSVLYEKLVGRDQWRHYIAYQENVPVATGSIFFNDRGAWCGNGATLRRYRRRGLHTALSRRRVSDGIEAGCDFLSGETWLPASGHINQSLLNLTRDGWQEVYTRVNYALRAD